MKPKIPFGQNSSTGPQQLKPTPSRKIHLSSTNRVRVQPRGRSGPGKCGVSASVTGTQATPVSSSSGRASAATASTKLSVSKERTCTMPAKDGGPTHTTPPFTESSYRGSAASCLAKDARPSTASTKYGGPATVPQSQTVPPCPEKESVVIPSTLPSEKEKSVSPSSPTPARKRRRPPSLQNSPKSVVPDGGLQAPASSASVPQRCEGVVSTSKSGPVA
ncbi:hypothetical protein PIB30_029787 [Stylosanthes scabra]|uniref:Uncharacterized protein n=1 Tax=Stylosanthes scabra TaxID=79078 RepID=A0ABU6SAY5_9FABA|nr:hypothetical protein [Stylosanthes scabra]